MTNSADFEQYRGSLLAVAYRLLGSAAEAEDAVQDTWLRWRSADEASIREPRAWLCRVLSRICIDRLTSARARREVYPGTWLPEPVLTTSPVDAESISLGFLVLLERLSPLERAVFVLRRAFDYTHVEIAETVGISEAASRQSLHRAKLRLADGIPRFSADRAAHSRLLEAFARVLASGEVSSIAALLAEDATLFADGGGKVPGAALRPICGREPIARFLVGLRRKTDLGEDFILKVAEVNGWPSLIGQRKTGTLFVMMIETNDVNITSIHNVVNPDKLGLSRVN
ncbi:MAG: RNA polymerase sigma factor SigJ [Polyangiales bacterium]